MFEVVSCRMGARQSDDVHASYPGSGRAALAELPVRANDWDSQNNGELPHKTT
jgi:hypothetical protein